MEIIGYVGLFITLGYLYFSIFKIDWLKEKIHLWFEREEKVINVLYYEVVTER